MESVSLTDLADHHLEVARTSSSGRSAQALHPGRHHHLRLTLIALRGGQALGEHESPGEATLQVLRGSVRLGSDGGAVEVSAGGLVVVPLERHDLAALEDAVVVLTTVVDLPE